MGSNRSDICRMLCYYQRCAHVLACSAWPRSSRVHDAVNALDDVDFVVEKGKLAGELKLAANAGRDTQEILRRLAQLEA
jgi:hypothetical protein